MKTFDATNAADLAEILRLLYWTQRGLADRLGVEDGRIRGWLDPEDGRVPPPEVAAWLEALAAHAAQWPVPELNPARAAAARERLARSRRGRNGRGVAEVSDDQAAA